MFERYTEKARRVIFFARFEASEFGSPYIESAFLLLGLLRESKYVIVRWLEEEDWETILRAEVERRVHRGPKTPTSADLPLSQDCIRVLAYAAEEAERLAHPMISTEHLFLGLLRDPDSVAAKILLERGVDAGAVRSALAKEGMATHPGTGGGSAIGRVSHTLPIVIVTETEALHPFWQLQAPAVGDRLTVRHRVDEVTVYEVVRVEWEVTSLRPELPFLSKVMVHVRKQATV